MRTVIPTQFQVGPAPWTAAIPGLPIALGGAIAIYELAFSLRPVAGLVLLTAGLGIYSLRQSSRVRIADGRLSMRWFSPTDQVVDLDRLVEARPTRTMSFGLGAVNVLRLRDRWGGLVDLPLDRWAREKELREIIAAAARQVGIA